MSKFDELYESMLDESIINEANKYPDVIGFDLWQRKMTDNLKAKTKSIDSQLQTIKELIEDEFGEWQTTYTLLRFDPTKPETVMAVIETWTYSKSNEVIRDGEAITIKDESADIEKRMKKLFKKGKGVKKLVFDDSHLRQRNGYMTVIEIELKY